jgi:hypothetical protein
MADSRSTGISVGGRIADYLVGRNSLTGIASLMLLVIFGYATWSGMADFIIGVSTSPAAAHGREIVGGLPVSNEIVVIAIVVASSCSRRICFWHCGRSVSATASGGA